MSGPELDVQVLVGSCEPQVLQIQLLASPSHALAGPVSLCCPDLLLSWFIYLSLVLIDDVMFLLSVLSIPYAVLSALGLHGWLMRLIYCPLPLLV